MEEGASKVLSLGPSHDSGHSSTGRILYEVELASLNRSYTIGGSAILDDLQTRNDFCHLSYVVVGDTHKYGGKDTNSP